MRHNDTVGLEGKFQLKPGQSVSVLNVPDGTVLDLADATPAADPDSADAVIVFVRTRAELDAHAGPAVAAAERDALSWLAYPKAGQLGTDLNRDSLAEAMTGHGVRPVRQIAVDGVWSALRFRSAT